NHGTRSLEPAPAATLKGPRGPDGHNGKEGSGCVTLRLAPDTHWLRLQLVQPKGFKLGANNQAGITWQGEKLIRVGLTRIEGRYIRRAFTYIHRGHFLVIRASSRWGREGCRD